MGDRCHVWVTFRTKDWEKAKEILYAEDDNYGGTRPTEPFFEVEEEEANYGWGDVLGELASAGIIFYGNHSSGATYGPMIFACENGRVWEHSVDEDGNMIVRVSDKGEPLKREVSYAKQFIRLQERVKRRVRGEPDQKKRKGGKKCRTSR